MATKEVLIKVKVEGQEIALTSKQLDLFKKNAEDLRKELDALGQRTEQNSEQFDKLTGDLDKLDQMLSQTKEEAKDTGDGMEEMGDKAEGAGKKTESLRSQLSKARNDLAALGPRTAENAQLYDNLTSKVQELSEAYEEVQFGTKKLDDALAAIPGPIGQAAGAFKTFDDTVKNLKSALGTLGRDFKGVGDSIKNFKIGDLGKGLKGLIPTLGGLKTGLLNVGKAIIATGIGAFVVVIGLLVAALGKALTSFKPLQDALSRFGVLFEVLQQAVQPVVELIGTALTEALNFLSKAIAFVTGNLDEFNKKLADKKAAEQAAKNLEKQKFDLEALGDTYTEVERKKEEARIKAADKIKEINEDEVLSEQEKADRIKSINARLDRDIQAAIDEDNKAKADKAKEAADKARQIEDDYQKRLQTLRDQNTLLAITDEQEKQKKQLEIQKDAQLKEIDALKVSEKKKQELRNETLKNYGLQLKILNDNILKEQKKADEDLAKQTRDIRTSMIQDEKERLAEEAKNRRDDALKAIDDTKATEEAKAAAKLAINQKYADDVSKIDEEIAKKNKENVYRQIEFERESRALGLQNRLKEIDLNTQSELAKVEARRLVLEEQAKLDLEAEQSNLRKLLETKEITQDEFNTREAERKRAFELTLTQIELENVTLRQQARQNEINAYAQLGNSVLNLVGLFQKEGEESKALVKAQEALTLATNIATFANNIQALSELGKAYGKQVGKASALPFPASLGAIAAVIGSFIGVLATGKQLFGIGKKGGSASADSGAAASPNLGRNYEKGGMINGPRHAQGGTLIEAEGGEAVMTRGAVTLFKPMLSMMNQMGGGTSFTPNLRTTSYDNPVVDNVAQKQEPTIIKTYVVSNELTNEAEKLARLKDLSTL
jgi:hypothetical protein